MAIVNGCKSLFVASPIAVLLTTFTPDGHPDCFHSMAKTIIGVMGPGEQATEVDRQVAYRLGQEIAQAGWALLTGGRNAGVMDAVSQGAKSVGGLTIGILPDGDRAGMSQAIDIAILTGMGSARNNINVLSSDVVVACGMGAGTASEVALAIKAARPVLLLNVDRDSQQFFQTLSATVVAVATVDETIAQIRQLLPLERA